MKILYLDGGLSLREKVENGLKERAPSSQVLYAGDVKSALEVYDKEEKIDLIIVEGGPKRDIEKTLEKERDYTGPVIQIHEESIKCLLSALGELDAERRSIQPEENVKKELKCLAWDIAKDFGEQTPKKPDTWTQVHYNFEHEDFRITRWETADGVVQHSIFHKDVKVYADDYYDGSFTGVMRYVPGNWEEELKKMYKDLCFAQKIIITFLGERLYGV